MRCAWRVMLTVLLSGASCRTPEPWEPLGAATSDARKIDPGLALHCEPGEADVLLDGVLQGSCVDLDGRVLSLSEGTHRVEVRKAGHRPYEAVVATGLARTALKVQLVPLP
ncbi:MAG: hypothetical protein HY901_21500 [Deltaproteobacteria bacterium]|nr:hypothetical protein [Deltaproteobacteria bacterium]